MGHALCMAGKMPALQTRGFFRVTETRKLLCCPADRGISFWSFNPRGSRAHHRSAGTWEPSQSRLLPPYGD